MMLARSFVTGLALVSFAGFAGAAQKPFKSARLAAVNFAANKLNHSAAFPLAKDSDALGRAIRGTDLSAKPIKGAKLSFNVTNKAIWNGNGGETGANVALRVTVKKVKGGFVALKTSAKVSIDQQSFEE
jgi:hypothetical protein